MTEEDRNSLKEALIKQIGEDVFNQFNEEAKNEALKELASLIKRPAASAEFEENLETAIFYPDTKAIAQLVLHEVPIVNIEEISYEELKEIPSERGNGKLGSSGK